jgi:hypothetical protein
MHVHLQGNRKEKKYDVEVQGFAFNGGWINGARVTLVCTKNDESMQYVGSNRSLLSELI